MNLAAADAAAAAAAAVNSSSLMSAATRSVSPIRTPFHPLSLSPLHPHSASLKSSTTTTTTTATHLANLELLLQKHSPPPPFLTHDHPDKDTATSFAAGGVIGGLLNALNLHALFPTAAEAEMSPRSLRQLQRLLSDSSRPSPRNTIAPNWRRYHGAGNWQGLLDPLDENLRRELVRYGDLVQSAYHAFHSSSIPADSHRSVALPDRHYRVTRSLYATASVELPSWVSAAAPWAAQKSSWIGFVAVCDSDREVARMGRRDIVIALRGTATCLEWAENFRAGLVPVDDAAGRGAAAKVECGFKSLYKTEADGMPSLSAMVVEEVRRLMERYKGEELSITVTGHSLGAALAVLVADELSACVPEAPPVAVFSFGSPRVGNRSFAERLGRRGVKVLRVVNANDVVTRVPVAPPRVLEGLDGYADVGMELRVDSKVSPYLRPNADPACCHDLEAYLHLVDGFLGSQCPFRSNAKRSLARLLSQQGPNVKKLYMTTVRSLKADSLATGRGRGRGVTTCLPSPSH